MRLDQAQLIDQLCDEFESSWQGDRPERIGEFLDRADPEMHHLLFKELLLLELRLADTLPPIEDYLNLFPDDHERIISCFELTRSVSDFSPPTTGDGRFKIVRLLIQGGLGRIWIAEDLELNRQVALKDMKSALASDPSSKKRFLQEAEITGRLEHPGIVPIYALGHYENGKPYYVMRMIRGQTLRDAIRQFHQKSAAGQPLDRYSLELRKLLNSFIEVCNTIHYAHSKSVIHRDIKPDNVMLGEFGETLVVDWGLATTFESQNPDTVSMSRSNPDDSDPDQASTIAGTLQYMSPEQARGHSGRLCPRSDIYSLGATLYCVLTNRPPFPSSKHVSKVLHAVQSGDIPRPRQLDKRIPKALEEVCLKAVAVQPEQRYASAKELADDIERWLASEPVSAMRESLTEKVVRLSRRHRSLVRSISWVAVFLMIAGLVAGWFWYRMPGTLVVRIHPENAIVEIDNSTYQVSGSSLQLQLRPGVYELSVRAPNYDTDHVAVLVKRGQTKDINVSLPRHRGLLNADCWSPDTELEIGGISYGSKIRNLSLPVESYTALAKKDYCFDSRPIHFEIAEDRQHNIRMFLDEGLIWKYASMGVQHAVEIVGDIDGDQIPDLFHNEVDRVVFFSGKSGAVIGDVSIPIPYSTCLLGIGTDDLRLIVAKEKQARKSRSGQTRSVIEISSWRVGKKIERQWDTKVAIKTHDLNAYVAIIETSDLNDDGKTDLAILSRDGLLTTIDSNSGQQISQFRVAEVSAQEAILGRCRNVPHDQVLLNLSDSEKTNEFGCFDLKTGRFRWKRSSTKARVNDLADFDRDRWRDYIIRTDSKIEVVSGKTGVTFFDKSLSQNNGSLFVAACVRNDLPAWLIGFANRVECFDANGNLVWTQQGQVARFQPMKATGKIRQVQRHVFLQFQNELRVVDVQTGLVQWSIPGVAAGVLCDDWDGDGIAEILVGKKDGLSAYTKQGKLMWHLRMPYSVRPDKFLPDSDGDGFPELMVVQNRALIAKIRGPRVLWKANAQGLLLAQPGVFHNAEQQPRVIQSGNWGADSSFGCLDGTNGRLLWTSDIVVPNNRTQAITDFDRDGVPDLVTLGYLRGAIDLHLLVVDTTNGKLKRAWRLDGPSAVYCTPLVHDFNNDGFNDVVAMRWDQSDVILIDGATKSVAWKQFTGGNNIGAMAMAGINDDRVLDIIVPSGDGSLIAIDSSTGKRLWKRPLGKWLRGEPLVVDLEQDGQDEIIVLANLEPVEGQNSKIRMYVVNANDGNIRWFYEKQSKALSKRKIQARPVVVRVHDGQITNNISDQQTQTMIIATLCQDGVVAIDARTKKPVWQRTFDSELVSTPIVADVDRDQVGEVIFTSYDGQLIVLDLMTGKTLLKIAMGDGKISAAVSIADLNSDGIADLLVAEQQHTLSAIDGRTIRAARKTSK